MGKQYQAKCLTCSHEFTLLKGGGMKWYQKVCDTCGNCIGVPRNAPEIANNTMDRAQLIQHLADSPGWSRKGGKFEPSERAIIEELTSQCGCGGQMIPEWKEGALYRCPECRGYRLELLTDIPIAYD
jgi:hypothetical protein